MLWKVDAQIGHVFPHPLLLTYGLKTPGVQYVSRCECWHHRFEEKQLYREQKSTCSSFPRGRNLALGRVYLALVLHRRCADATQRCPVGTTNQPLSWCILQVVKHYYSLWCQNLQWRAGGQGQGEIQGTWLWWTEISHPTLGAHPCSTLISNTLLSAHSWQSAGQWGGW